MLTTAFDLKALFAGRLVARPSAIPLRCYRPFNTPPLYAQLMRLILLLSALLSAFATGIVPARAAGVSAVQVGTLVRVVAARAAVATAGRRPLVTLPRINDVLAASIAIDAPALTVPLYARRLRV